MSHSDRLREVLIAVFSSAPASGSAGVHLPRELIQLICHYSGHVFALVTVDSGGHPCNQRGPSHHITRLNLWSTAGSPHGDDADDAVDDTTAFAISAAAETNFGWRDLQLAATIDCTVRHCRVVAVTGLRDGRLAMIHDDGGLGLLHLHTKQLKIIQPVMDTARKAGGSGTTRLRLFFRQPTTRHWQPQRAPHAPVTDRDRYFVVAGVTGFVVYDLIKERIAFAVGDFLSRILDLAVFYHPAAALTGSSGSASVEPVLHVAVLLTAYDDRTNDVRSESIFDESFDWHVPPLEAGSSITGLAVWEYEDRFRKIKPNYRNAIEVYRIDSGQCLTSAPESKFFLPDRYFDQLLVVSPSACASGGKIAAAAAAATTIDFLLLHSKSGPHEHCDWYRLTVNGALKFMKPNPSIEPAMASLPPLAHWLLNYNSACNALRAVGPQLVVTEPCTASIDPETQDWVRLPADGNRFILDLANQRWAHYRFDPPPAPKVVPGEQPVPAPDLRGFRGPISLDGTTLVGTLSEFGAVVFDTDRWHPQYTLVEWSDDSSRAVPPASAPALAARANSNVRLTGLRLPRASGAGLSFPAGYEFYHTLCATACDFPLSVRTDTGHPTGTFEPFLPSEMSTPIRASRGGRVPAIKAKRPRWAARPIKLPAATARGTAPAAPPPAQAPMPGFGRGRGTPVAPPEPHFQFRVRAVPQWCYSPATRAFGPTIGMPALAARLSGGNSRFRPLSRRATLFLVASCQRRDVSAVRFLFDLGITPVLPNGRLALAAAFLIPQPAIAIKHQNLVPKSATAERWDELNELIELFIARCRVQERGASADSDRRPLSSYVPVLSVVGQIVRAQSESIAVCRSILLNELHSETARAVVRALDPTGISELLRSGKWSRSALFLLHVMCHAYEQSRADGFDAAATALVSLTSKEAKDSVKSADDCYTALIRTEIGTRRCVVSKKVLVSAISSRPVSALATANDRTRLAILLHCGRMSSALHHSRIADLADAKVAGGDARLSAPIQAALQRKASGVGRLCVPPRRIRRETRGAAEAAYLKEWTKVLPTESYSLREYMARIWYPPPPGVEEAKLAHAQLYREKDKYKPDELQRLGGELWRRGHYFPVYPRLAVAIIILYLYEKPNDAAASNATASKQPH